MNPSYEELFALVKHQSKVIFEQQQTIKRLEKRIVALEEQLKLNSKNSSKPPSSDQKASKEPPKKGGAKPGHPGHFRALFAPEQIHKHIPLQANSCPACGNAVKQIDEPPSIHQQVEVPKECFFVTQYERHHFYCPCCRAYGVAPLPPGVGTSAFGTRLTALMSFLSGTCRLGKRMVLRVLQEGLGIKAAIGSVSNIERRVSHALLKPYEEIAKEVRSSQDTKHLDETSWRQWGKTEYLWVMSTKKAAFYKIQSNRNAECRDALLGEARWAKAAFVTDRFAVYRFEGGSPILPCASQARLKPFC